MAATANVVHREQCPVLLIGHGSSGTSLLSRLIREYLRVSFGTESQFLLHFAQRQAAYGDLAEVANQRRLIEHLLAERWFVRSGEKFGFATTADQILAEVQEPSYAGIVAAVFRLLARHQGMTRWGDKTPDYVLNLPALHTLFPQAKYLHLVRDGRDVALSVLARPWGPKNIYLAAHQWRRAVELAEEFAATLPAGQILHVRYEDLLAQPLTVFGRLLEFLQVDDAGGGLQRQLAAALPGEVRADNSNKWRVRWNDYQRRQYEAVAGATLQHHGYETLPDVEPVAVSAWGHFAWQVDSELRKLAFWGNWVDNWYKLKLRTRQLLQQVR